VRRVEYASRVPRPLKNPETKAEFWAMEWDFRVPSSSWNARPILRGLGVSSVGVVSGLGGSVVVAMNVLVVEIRLRNGTSLV